ncbi:MAG TPA: hypothetical protein VF210_18000 [Pseudomonadales bacterium]
MVSLRFPDRAGRRAALAIAALVAFAVPAAAWCAEDSEQAARQVMTDFLAAFNARDEAAWADTLLFPHVRLASGTVRVYPDRQAFLAEMDLTRFAEQTGWDHSTWDDMRVIQASPDKVHIAVTFSRFDAEGSRIGSYDSLYVIERAGGRWGVRARSSFAP